MKGVVLAGGSGTRLNPITKIVNKQCLPIYNKPMLYYPLYTLKSAGITEIMLVSSPDHLTAFQSLLGDGAELGISLKYAVQDYPGGIAHAVSFAEKFVAGDDVAVVLGDNVFEDGIADAVAEFNGGAHLFVKEVENPRAFGVAEVSEGRIVNLEEKPAEPKSNLAVLGCYLYDNQLFDVIRGIVPSARGELEITSVNERYLELESVKYTEFNGFWGDCGEFDGLLKTANLVANSHLGAVDKYLTLDGGRVASGLGHLGNSEVLTTTNVKTKN